MANAASMLQGQQAVKSVKHPLLHPSPFFSHSYLLLLRLPCTVPPPTLTRTLQATNPVNNKLHGQKCQDSAQGKSNDGMNVCCLLCAVSFVLRPSVDACNSAAAAWQHPNLSQSTVQLCRAQRPYEAAASGGLLNPACSSHDRRTLAPIPTSLSNERCRSA